MPRRRSRVRVPFLAPKMYNSPKTIRKLTEVVVDSTNAPQKNPSEWQKIYQEVDSTIKSDPQHYAHWRVVQFIAWLITWLTTSVLSLYFSFYFFSATPQIIMLLILVSLFCLIGPTALLSQAIIAFFYKYLYPTRSLKVLYFNSSVLNQAKASFSVPRYNIQQSNSKIAFISFVIFLLVWISALLSYALSH